MLLAALHWLFKWLMIPLTIWAFVNMCKTVNRPLGTRWVTMPSGRRVRKTQLDNVLDGTGAAWGFVMFLGLTIALWLF